MEKMRNLLCVGLLFLSGCGSINMADKAILNHPAMDLSQNQTHDFTGALCGLGNNSSTMGQGCTTCAH